MAPVPVLRSSSQFDPRSHTPSLPRIEALDRYCVRRRRLSMEKLPSHIRYLTQHKSIRCTVAGCDKVPRRRGLCFKHGGKVLCKVAGCQSCAHSRGMCIKHGGGQRCEVENCTRAAQLHQRCCRHGGKRQCSFKDCKHLVKAHGLCRRHQDTPRNSNEKISR